MAWGMFGSRAESWKFLKNLFLFVMEQFPNVLLRSPGSLLLWGPIGTSWLKRRSALLCEYLPLKFLLSAVLITMAEVISQWTRQTDLPVSPRKAEKTRVLNMVELLLIYVAATYNSGQGCRAEKRQVVMRNEPVILGSARNPWNRSKIDSLHSIYCIFCSILPNGKLPSTFSPTSFWSNRNFWYPWSYLALGERLRHIGTSRFFKICIGQLNILLLPHFS